MRNVGIRGVIGTANTKKYQIPRVGIFSAGWYFFQSNWYFFSQIGIFQKNLVSD